MPISLEDIVLGFAYKGFDQDMFINTLNTSLALI